CGRAAHRSDDAHGRRRRAHRRAVPAGGRHPGAPRPRARPHRQPPDAARRGVGPRPRRAHPHADGRRAPRAAAPQARRRRAVPDWAGARRGLAPGRLMRRLRLVFAAVCAVLLVGLGLLVRRAVESVALERELRHRVVADRVFDEMERALSEFLAREEERPFGQYRYTYAPPGQLGNAVAVTRSPLADPPALDFVVGPFQIDPDGSLHTPLRPDDGEAADWKPTADVSGRIATLERTVGTQWHAAAKEGRVLDRRQRPGTTVDVAGGAAPERRERLRALGYVEEKGAVASAYDALES